MTITQTTISVHQCQGFPGAAIKVYRNPDNWGWYVSMYGEPTPRCELSDELREYVQNYMMQNFPEMVGG